MLPFFINNSFPVNDDVRAYALRDVVDIVKSGNWFRKNEDNHGVTTDPTLFDRSEPHWQILRASFINSVFEDYSLNTSKRFDVTAWCYINEPNKPSILNWHIHSDSRDSINTKRFTGILYLNIPMGEDNFLSSTTEFLLKDGSTVSCPPVLNRWIFFDSLQHHRPGVWMFNKMREYRVTLAADLVLYE